MNKIAFLFYFSICSLPTLLAQEQVRGIDSGTADYDGKKITLTGDVMVDHELGKIQANHVVIFSDPLEKKIRFAFLKMKENIKISLKDGGELTCANADLDYGKMTGIFLGDGAQEFVIYSETSKDRAGKATPLTVSSRQMDMQIAREGTTGKQSPKSYINEILAKDSVKIDFNQTFIAIADHAIYHRAPEEALKTYKSDKLTGILTLYPGNGCTDCQVTNREGDLVASQQITIDIAKRNLLFSYPKGSINGSRKGHNSERLEFSADNLIWDDPREILTLRNHVVINQKGIGTINNEQEVIVYQHTFKGKKQIRTIEGKGLSTLAYNDDEKKLTHALTCFGGFVIDHEKLQATFNSASDSQGKIKENEQVYFRDRMGEIYSDKLLVKYDIIDDEIVPTKLNLQGNVHILDRFAVNPEEIGPLLRYAIADEVEYYPLTKEIFFSSTNKRRVLFFDKVNNMQVSAPGLKIKRDQTTNKESIQGIGDVRFSFADQEFEQLKKRFQLIEDVKKNERINGSQK
jgi:lipopolysaccharide export system protein LptA